MEKNLIKSKNFKRILITVLLLSLVTFSFVACGSSGGDVNYDAENGSMIGGGTVPEDLKDLKLIYQAKINVETDDYNKYIGDLETKIVELGGYISSANETSSESLKRAVLTIRVPSENYEAMKKATALNGTVVNSSHEVVDVTESYTDIEGRLATLKAEREALNAMLEKADSISTMLEIRKEINELNIEIESYQRQLNSYDGRIAYSTISLTVEQEIEDDTTGFGWIILTIILFIAPETIICMGVCVVIAVIIVKKKKNKRI
ncbi:MAG: DUF4349 domain-containing protein [Ruminococcaceae bacterium]|nr:DUF4349 domain-containing protein [Oscillospiraceae bacterium]